VLRPLALVAVWQQHGQAAEALPLVLTAGDELVDHHLRAIGKVAELRLPDHQTRGRGGRIAVFKGQHCLLGQEGIVNHKTRLLVTDMLQWHVCRGCRAGCAAPHGDEKTSRDPRPGP
jgi:hypothetical protein